MLMLQDTFSPELSVNCHITINCTDLLHAVRDVALAVQETNSVYCQKPIKDELNLMPNSDSRYDCCYLLLSSKRLIFWKQSIKRLRNVLIVSCRRKKVGNIPYHCREYEYDITLCAALYHIHKSGERRVMRNAIGSV